MKLKDQEFAALLKLARLKPKAAIKQHLVSQLPAVLEFVEKLGKAAPGHAAQIETKPPQVLKGRPDEVVPNPWPLARPEDLIEMAPAKHGSFWAVPQMFEEKIRK